MGITQTNFVAGTARLNPISWSPGRPVDLLARVQRHREPLNPCGNNDTIANALTTTRGASKSAADVDAAYKTLQKTVDESPWWSPTPGAARGAHEAGAGVDIINSPYGPQLNTISMTSSK
jgi:hypothetical protein